MKSFLYLFGFVIDTFHGLTLHGKSDNYILTTWVHWEFRL